MSDPIAFSASIRGELPNTNGRIYPAAVMKAALDRAVANGNFTIQPVESGGPIQIGDQRILRPGNMRVTSVSITPNGVEATVTLEDHASAIDRLADLASRVDQPPN